jgi:hypothetical protein
MTQTLPLHTFVIALGLWWSMLIEVSVPNIVDTSFKWKAEDLILAGFNMSFLIPEIRSWEEISMVYLVATLRSLFGVVYRRASR